MLTDAKIRGLRGEPNVRREYKDGLVEGLRLRVSTASKVWIVRRKLGDGVKTHTLGPFGSEKGELSLAEARRRAVEIESDAKSGIVPTRASPRRMGPKRRGHVTLNEFIETFMNVHVADRGVKRPEAYRWLLTKYAVPAFGEWELRAITKGDCKTWIADLRERHGTTTARRAAGLFSRLLNFADDQEVIDHSPMSKVSLPGTENVRKRVLNPRELKAFWQATDHAFNANELNRAGRPQSHPSDYPWGAYFRLLLLTGQRRGEVAAMRWASIDLEEGNWFLEADETKSDRAHIVPLSPLAVELLRGLPRLSTTTADGKNKPSPFVLTTNGSVHIGMHSKPKRWLDAAILELLKRDDEDAELPHWVVHDLRRTVSTNLARLKVFPDIRRRVLNHAPEGLDRIYDQFDYLDEKREALTIWASSLLHIVGQSPQPPDNVVPIRGVG